MPNIEYLDPEIASEGSHAESGFDLEPAHVWDYAPLKTDKKYKKYFQPYKYVRYPADFYHANGETKRVYNDAEALALECRPHRNTWICEGEWHDEESVARKVKINFHAAGKNLVVASSQQSAASSNEMLMQIVQQMAKGQNQVASNDVMQVLTGILQQMQLQNGINPVATLAVEADGLSEADQKAILTDLAKEKNIKIDKRWGLDKIKEALDEAGDRAA